MYLNEDMDDAARWNTNDTFKLAPFTPAVGALRHWTPSPSSPPTVTSSDESSAASSTGKTSASSGTLRARAVTYNQARKVFLKLFALGFDLPTCEQALEYGLAPRLNEDETLAESALKYAIECTQRSEARNIHYKTPTAPIQYRPPNLKHAKSGKSILKKTSGNVLIKPRNTDLFSGSATPAAVRNNPVFTIQKDRLKAQEELRKSQKYFSFSKPIWNARRVNFELPHMAVDPAADASWGIEAVTQILPKFFSFHNKSLKTNDDLKLKDDSGSDMDFSFLDKIKSEKRLIKGSRQTEKEAWFRSGSTVTPAPSQVHSNPITKASFKPAVSKTERMPAKTAPVKQMVEQKKPDVPKKDAPKAADQKATVKRSKSLTSFKKWNYVSRFKHASVTEPKALPGPPVTPASELAKTPAPLDPPVNDSPVQTKKNTKLVKDKTMSWKALAQKNSSSNPPPLVPQGKQVAISSPTVTPVSTAPSQIVQLRSPQQSDVTCFDLSSIHVTTDNISAIMSFLIANTQLTQVVLRNCNLTDEVLKLLLGPLLSLRNLRFLSLASNSDLTENAIKYVTVFLKRCPMLRILDLSNIRMNQQSLSYLSNALVSCSLEKLAMNHCRIQSSDFDGFAEFVKRSTLRHLSLAHNVLGWEAGSLIAGMLRCDQESNGGLVSLNLRGNRIESGLAAISEALSRNHTLVDLNLRRNNLNSDCLCVLSECLKINKTVRRIDISGNPLFGTGYEGLLSLAEALEINPSLQLVSLANTNLNAEDCRVLFNNISDWKCIKEVNVAYNHLDLSSVKGLSERLSGSSTILHIEVLPLLDTQFTEGEEEELEQYFGQIESICRKNLAELEASRQITPIKEPAIKDLALHDDNLSCGSDRASPSRRSPRKAVPSYDRTALLRDIEQAMETFQNLEDLQNTPRASRDKRTILQLYERLESVRWKFNSMDPLSLPVRNVLKDPKWEALLGMDTDVSRVMPPQEADAVSITSNSNNLWDSSSENTAETSDTESIFDDYLDEMMDQRRVSNTISSVDSVQDFSGDDSVSLLMFQIERAVSDLNAIQFSILDDLIYSAAGH